MSDSKRTSKKKAALPKEDRLKIIERVKSGDVRAEVARDFGISRQYVSQLWQKYEKGGKEAILETVIGRKKTRPLTSEEMEHIHTIVSTPGGPSAAGIHDCGSTLQWTMKGLQTLMRRELDFTPTQATIRLLMDGWGIHIVRPDNIIDVYADEEDDRKDTEAHGYVSDAELARRIAIRDAKKRGEPAPEFPEPTPMETSKPPLSPDLPEDDMELDEEAFMELRDRIMRQDAADASATQPSSFPPAPGQRFGKHKNAKANRTPPRKKRKKAKKRKKR